MNKIKYLEETRDNEDEELNISGFQDDQESDDDYDDVEDLPTNQATKKYRGSISAEVFTGINVKPKTDAKNKSDVQYNNIIELLKKCFIFKTIDPDDYKLVINAMVSKTFAEGELVIKQGDDGNEMYLVEKGNLNCSKTIEDGSEMQIRT